jgi:hypothetical protein
MGGVMDMFTGFGLTAEAGLGDIGRSREFLFQFLKLGVIRVRGLISFWLILSRLSSKHHESPCQQHNGETQA